MAPEEKLDKEISEIEEVAKVAGIPVSTLKVGGGIVAILAAILVTLNQFGLLSKVQDKIDLEKRFADVTKTMSDNKAEATQQFQTINIKLDKISEDMARDRDQSKSYLTEMAFENWKLKYARLNPTVVMP